MFEKNCKCFKRKKKLSLLFSSAIDQQMLIPNPMTSSDFESSDLSQGNANILHARKRIPLALLEIPSPSSQQKKPISHSQSKVLPPLCQQKIISSPNQTKIPTPPNQTQIPTLPSQQMIAAPASQQKTPTLLSQQKKLALPSQTKRPIPANQQKIPTLLNQSMMPTPLRPTKTLPPLNQPKTCSPLKNQQKIPTSLGLSKILIPDSQPRIPTPSALLEPKDRSLSHMEASIRGSPRPELDFARIHESGNEHSNSTICDKTLLSQISSSTRSNSGDNSITNRYNLQPQLNAATRWDANSPSMSLNRHIGSSFISLSLILLCMATLSLADERYSNVLSKRTDLPLSLCSGNHLHVSSIWFRHPTNCSIFFTCHRHQVWQMACSSPHEVFSLKHRVCVWKNSQFDDCKIDLAFQVAFPMNRLFSDSIKGGLSDLQKAWRSGNKISQWTVELKKQYYDNFTRQSPFLVLGSDSPSSSSEPHSIGNNPQRIKKSEFTENASQDSIWWKRNNPRLSFNGKQFKRYPGRVNRQDLETEVVSPVLGTPKSARDRINTGHSRDQSVTWRKEYHPLGDQLPFELGQIIGASLHRNTYKIPPVSYQQGQRRTVSGSENYTLKSRLDPVPRQGEGRTKLNVQPTPCCIHPLGRNFPPLTSTPQQAVTRAATTQRSWGPMIKQNHPPGQGLSPLVRDQRSQRGDKLQEELVSPRVYTYRDLWMSLTTTTRSPAVPSTLGLDSSTPYKVPDNITVNLRSSLKQMSHIAQGNSKRFNNYYHNTTAPTAKDYYNNNDNDDHRHSSQTDTRPINIITEGQRTQPYWYQRLSANNLESNPDKHPRAQYNPDLMRRFLSFIDNRTLTQRHGAYLNKANPNVQLLHQKFPQNKGRFAFQDNRRPDSIRPPSSGRFHTLRNRKYYTTSRNKYYGHMPLPTSKTGFYKTKLPARDTVKSRKIRVLYPRRHYIRTRQELELVSRNRYRYPSHSPQNSNGQRSTRLRNEKQRYLDLLDSNKRGQRKNIRLHAPETKVIPLHSFQRTKVQQGPLKKTDDRVSNQQQFGNESNLKSVLRQDSQPLPTRRPHQQNTRLGGPTDSNSTRRLSPSRTNPSIATKPPVNRAENKIQNLSGLSYRDRYLLLHKSKSTNHNELKTRNHVPTNRRRLNPTRHRQHPDTLVKGRAKKFSNNRHISQRSREETIQSQRRQNTLRPSPEKVNYLEHRTRWTSTHQRHQRKLPRPRTTATTTMMTTTTTTTTTTTALPKPWPTLPELETKLWGRRSPSDQPVVPEYRRQLNDRCGIMARPLIIGGRRSSVGQWPWQVSLQIITSTTPWHRCGGVLVHARWVLTAAHCMEGPFYGNIGNWRVVMADYDLATESGREIYRKIIRVISHPGYVRSSNYPNDVALLELDRPVDMTSGEVQTACLPDANTKLSPGTQCWISGWGEVREHGGEQTLMNEVPVDVISTDTCKAMWGRVDIHVLDSQVCVGNGEIGACYGDSGGPLMCEQDGRFYVTGVMSWLIKNCSAPNFPNVFTRLPNYMDWLEDNLDLFIQ